MYELPGSSHCIRMNLNVSKNVQSDMCTHRRVKSAFASAQSDRILPCPQGDNFASLVIKSAPSEDSDQNLPWAHMSKLCFAYVSHDNFDEELR